MRTSCAALLIVLLAITTLLAPVESKKPRRSGGDDNDDNDDDSNYAQRQIPQNKRANAASSGTDESWLDLYAAAPIIRLDNNGNPLAPISQQAGIPPAIAACWKWLEDNGLQTGHLSMQHSPGSGWSLFAAVDLEAYGLIFELPKSVVMSTVTYLQSPLGPLLSAAGVDKDTAGFAMHLLNEVAKGDDSFWAPYLKILPQELDLAILFSQEELNDMVGTNAFEVAHALKDMLDAQYFQQVGPVMIQNPGLFKPLEAYTLERFYWAMSIIYSRCFDFHVSAGLERVLTPGLDFVNHDSRVTSAVYQSKENVIMKRRETVRAGEEIFISYGKKSSDELLMMYGFVLENNPYESYKINIDLSPQDPLYEEKGELLKAMNFEAESDYKIYPDHLNPDILSVLRVHTLTNEELEVGRAQLPQGGIVSIGQDSRIADMMLGALDGMLTRFPTTVAEDKAILANPDLPWRHRMIVMARKHDKETLHANMKMLRDRMNALNEAADLALVQKDPNTAMSDLTAKLANARRKIEMLEAELEEVKSGCRPCSGA